MAVIIFPNQQKKAWLANMEKKILGIDAGGTFTDFVLLSLNGKDAQLQVHKVLSTPDAPERAILQGIVELGLGDWVTSGRLHIIHGSTVATNAALENKGVRTAFVTNTGFADLLTLARQTRPSLYQLEFPPRPPPVPRELCL
ncbi:MAG: hydantoinase/oxoprolinase N-terminal domain-containing protein, partial [Pseudohongiellaceae bacterium]